MTYHRGSLLFELPGPAKRTPSRCKSVPVKQCFGMAVFRCMSILAVWAETYLIGGIQSGCPTSIFPLGWEQLVQVGARSKRGISTSYHWVPVTSIMCQLPN